MPDWKDLIFSDEPFETKARAIFEYQIEHNDVYRRFCEALGYSPGDSGASGDLDFPLLPVRAFKDAELTCKQDQEADITFRSSGTGNMKRSTHLVYDADIYRSSLVKGFQNFYDLDDIVILGYTPGYSDNENSSLIWMINELMKHDESGMSRFLPLDEPLKQDEVDTIEQSGRQLLLFGAAFGLLDLVEVSDVTLPSNSIVMETGGMKTRQREMNRSLLHTRLAKGFGLAMTRIHSEYGMAELLSQAYALGGRWFRSVPWMRVSIRDPEDPRQELPPRLEGLIGIVDLANVYSCSFLLTGDRGVMDNRGRFRVMGRWNPRDMRGCNFLIDED